MSREGEAGRPAGDPAGLMALRLYATVEGVGSAREFGKTRPKRAAYRWLAGGAPLNYHALDGTKIRASASKASFRTGETLLEIEAAVAEGLAAVKGELRRGAGEKRRFPPANRPRLG